MNRPLLLNRPLLPGAGAVLALLLLVGAPPARAQSAIESVNITPQIAAIIHQDGGGWNGGTAAIGGCTPSSQSGFMIAGQNDCRIIDNSSIMSNDPSLIVYAGLSGTSTNGESFGINWTIGGTLRLIRFTSAGGGLAADAAGLAAAIVTTADPALAAATYPAASPNGVKRAHHRHHDRR